MTWLRWVLWQMQYSSDQIQACKGQLIEELIARERATRILLTSCFFSWMIELCVRRTYTMDDSYRLFYLYNEYRGLRCWQQLYINDLSPFSGNLLRYCHTLMNNLCAWHHLHILWWLEIFFCNIAMLNMCHWRTGHIVAHISRNRTGCFWKLGCLVWKLFECAVLYNVNIPNIAG